MRGWEPAPRAYYVVLRRGLDGQMLFPINTHGKTAGGTPIRFESGLEPAALAAIELLAQPGYRSVKDGELLIVQRIEADGSLGGAQTYIVSIPAQPKPTVDIVEDAS